MKNFNEKLLRIGWELENLIIESAIIVMIKVL